MARTTIPVQEMLINNGTFKLQDIAWTAADAANDMEVVNDGNIMLLVKNDHTSPLNVACISIRDAFGRFGDASITTTNAKQSICGPFRPDLWNQPTGKMNVDIATDTSLYVAAVKFRPFI